MKDLIFTLIALCLGIYLCEAVTNNNWQQAFHASYFTVIGGVFVHFRVWIKSSNNIKGRKE